MRTIDADILYKSKFHPLPYTQIIPPGVDTESYKRGWNDAIDAIIESAPTIEPDPCEDAVSRVELLSAFPVDDEPTVTKSSLRMTIKHLPSVTPKRKVGRWIEEQRGIKVTQYKCSECGRTVIDDTTYDVAEDYPFCHCGADMRQREENK